jgi:hypothetical protein
MSVTEQPRSTLEVGYDGSDSRVRSPLSTAGQARR